MKKQRKEEWTEIFLILRFFLVAYVLVWDSCKTPIKM